MTHYDVLGIAPNASAADIRQAYRAQAARLHPDKHTGSRPDEAVAAERDMRRLNEARHVLADPGRRLRYDETMRPPPTCGPVVEDEPAHRRVAQPGDVSHGATLILILPITVLLVALVAIVIFTAYAPRPGSDGPGTVAGSSASGTVVAAIGDCVVVRGGHASQIVPCHEPNDGQVTAEVDRALPCPHVEERPIDAPSGSSSLCLAKVAQR